MKRLERIFLFSWIPWICIAACTAKEDQGDGATPTCTPPPGIQLDVSVSGTGFEEFADRPAAMRVLVNPDLVLTCSTGLVAANGTISLSGLATGPISSTRAELIVSSDDSPAFASGDQTFLFHVGTDGNLTGDVCDVQRGWDISVDGGSAQSEVTWIVDASCPGF